MQYLWVTAFLLCVFYYSTIKQAVQSKAPTPPDAVVLPKRVLHSAGGRNPRSLLLVEEHMFPCPRVSLCCPSGATQTCPSNFAGQVWVDPGRQIKAEKGVGILVMLLPPIPRFSRLQHLLSQTPLVSTPFLPLCVPFCSPRSLTSQCRSIELSPTKVCIGL